MGTQGYRARWSVDNALHHGLPQNRPRLWAVGIRGDTPGAEGGFNGLEPLAARLYLSLSDILDPCEEGDDPAKMPMGPAGALHVQRARAEVERRGL
ncbi:MAG: DNA cytosine methyltransferase, partial [Candidatus Fonsibacter sp.]